MKLFYKPTAVKQLKKLPLKEQRKVLKKIVLIFEDPYSGKQLKGELADLRSIRAWPYRIIYELGSNSVIIYSIAHRQSAYKQ